MAFAPDSEHLVLRTQDGLVLWNRRTNQKLWEVSQNDAESLAFSRADNHDIRDFSARVFATQVPRREVNLGNGKARAVMPAGRSDFGDQQVLRFVRAQSCARLQQFLRSTGVSC